MCQLCLLINLFSFLHNLFAHWQILSRFCLNHYFLFRRYHLNIQTKQLNCKSYIFVWFILKQNCFRFICLNITIIFINIIISITFDAVIIIVWFTCFFIFFFSRPSVTIFLYPSSLPSDLPDYILRSYRAVVVSSNWTLIQTIYIYIYICVCVCVWVCDYGKDLKLKTILISKIFTVFYVQYYITIPSDFATNDYK